MGVESFLTTRSVATPFTTAAVVVCACTTAGNDAAKTNNGIKRFTASLYARTSREFHDSCWEHALSLSIQQIWIS